MAKTDTASASEGQAEAPAQEDAPLVIGAHNPFVNQLLTLAQGFQDDHEALRVKVNANRAGLRSMRDQGLMSDQQAASLEEFYPTREHKPRKPRTTPTAA